MIYIKQLALHFEKETYFIDFNIVIKCVKKDANLIVKKQQFSLFKKYITKYIEKH